MDESKSTEESSSFKLTAALKDSFKEAVQDTLGTSRFLTEQSYGYIIQSCTVLLNEL